MRFHPAYTPTPQQSAKVRSLLGRMNSAINHDAVGKSRLRRLRRSLKAVRKSQSRDTLAMWLGDYGAAIESALWSFEQRTAA